MDKDEEQNSHVKNKKEELPETEEHKEKVEEKIDEELEQTFPASDPPSYSQPGNDDIKNCE